MAKLYAEITSDKGGRVVGKGGNEYIEIAIRHGNQQVTKLIVSREETIVPVMNSGQTTDGITVRRAFDGELIDYKLNS